MQSEMAEKLYQAAEESLRASLTAWAAAFDAAQANGADHVRWIVEEAAWNSNRRANEVRNLAWELADRVLSETRARAREEVLGQGAAAPPSGRVRLAEEPGQAAI